MYLRQPSTLVSNVARRFGRGRFRRIAVAALAVAAVPTAIGLVSATSAAAATPAFVQVNAHEITSGTTNSTPFTAANTAGNLIAAYVVWNNTGSVALSDTRGDAYVAATARVTWGNNWSAQVFYAKNIVGGSNTVTATFGTAINSFGIVYAHEYSGLDKANPVDVTASAIGTAAAMSSGSATTTSASDLLFGAGASINTVNQVGTGYTKRSGAFDNLTEDQVVSKTGSYAATAHQNSNAWVMQLVAFRAASSGGDTTPPTVSLTAPATGSTVSGSVTVSANASDNVAVASVQFLLDGNALGAADTSSPYSLSWDTTTAADGSHSLAALATDTSGNTTTSAPVSVTVSNGGALAGPVAAYAFNEGTGTTTADATGNGATGTLTTGATWGTGKFGSAVSLDGLTGTVGLGNPAQLQITGSMTISGWINPSTFPADDEAIVSKRIVGGPGYQLDTTVDTGVRTVGFKLTNSSGGDMIRYGATTLQPNTWYYVAGVYNATTQTMDVYLNGVLDDGTLVGPVTTSQQSSTANVTIGARTSAYFFNGRIDEVRIYNQALTGTRVQTDMNTPIGGGNPTDWSTFFQSNGRTGFGIGNSGLTPSSASSLKLAWTASDSGNPESGVFAQPIVVGGTTYWGSFDGNERATDATGHLLWKTFIGHVNDPTCTDPSSAGVVSTATVRSDVPVGGASSVLYVAGGDTKMYALNAATGAILWSTSLGVGPDHFIWSSPAVFGNSVYIGESSFGDCPLVQGQFLQLNRVTGAIQNTFNVVPNGCVGAGVWGSPAVDPIAGTIYFTTGNSDPTCAAGEPLGQSIVEVSASNLSLLGSWEVPAAQQTDDPDFGATPTLFSGVVGGQNTPLVGAIDKNGIFYALKRDALAAGPVWSTRIATGGGNPDVGSGDVSIASYDGATLYVGGDITTIGSQSCSGSVNALNPSTGSFKWRDCITNGWPFGGVVAGDGGVVAAGSGNNINVYDSSTGANVGSYTGTGPFWGTPSIANNTIYEGDMTGHIYAVTPSSTTTTTTTTTSPSTTSSSTSTTSSSTSTSSSSTSTTSSSSSTTSSSTSTTSSSTSTTSSSTSTTTTTMPTGGPPTFVQLNAATPQSPQSSVSVPYAAAQHSGDLNAIAIGFNDATSTITSVTDSAGNVYQLAAPLTRGAALSQAIYDAPNIKSAQAGTNTVTVQFSGAVPWVDLRIAEYAGVATVNPVDVAASASGSGTTANSGNLATTNATDLIFGAGMTTGGFTGASGFTTRIITTPDADIVFDKNVTSTGTYSAVAQKDNSAWIMQGVAFRGA